MTKIEFGEEERPDVLALRLLADAQNNHDNAVQHLKSIEGKDPKSLGINVTWHTASATTGYRELSGAVTDAVISMWPTIVGIAVELLEDKERTYRRSLMEKKRVSK